MSSSSQKELVFRDITARGWQLNLLRATWLPMIEKAVLIAIDGRGGHRPASDRRAGVVGCIASHATLANDIGAHEDSVGRALRKLKKAGLITATKRGCSGGSIIEDKRICWSNLDALWQEQNEAPDEVHPDIETDIDSGIHPDNDSDIDPDARSDKTRKRGNEETNNPPPPTSPAKPSEPKRRTVPAIPEGWGRVAKVLKARKVRARKPLCRALAASGVPVGLALETIAQASADATPGALYFELEQLGPDDVEDWIGRQRALAKQIRAAGERENVGEAAIVAMLKKNHALEFDEAGIAHEATEATK